MGKGLEQALHRRSGNMGKGASPHQSSDRRRRNHSEMPSHTQMTAFKKTMSGAGKEQSSGGFHALLTVICISAGNLELSRVVCTVCLSSSSRDVCSQQKYVHIRSKDMCKNVLRSVIPNSSKLKLPECSQQQNGKINCDIFIYCNLDSHENE